MDFCGYHFDTADGFSERNSNRIRIPIPAARRCSVRIDGLAFPAPRQLLQAKRRDLRLLLFSTAAETFRLSEA